MNKLIKNLMTLLIGAGIGISIMYALTESKPADTKAVSESKEKEPLYWVAPMDPNYRRDKPGKSPMGMDLVPVYSDEGNTKTSGPGVVNISPEVINNLGVRKTRVIKGYLSNNISTVGYIKFDENQLIHIHPRVDGWVENLNVKSIGDFVSKGQQLYELYSPTLVNAQEELVLALERNNKRLIQASIERLTALQVSNTVIEDIKRTRKVNQRIIFYATQDGVVDKLNIREGMYVKPGTTLMSIGNIDTVWVEAEIFERQASDIQKGLMVSMTAGFMPGKTWTGQVDHIYPTLDSKTRTLKVRLHFDNQDRLLKPNMFANVIIHNQSQDEILIIPREAVIRTGNSERVVLALGDGQFKSINIKTGRYSNSHIEVIEGLAEGEKIVTSAQFLIDSESNKTSDFIRMSSLVNSDNEAQTHHHMEHSQPEETVPDKVWVEAKINSIMVGHRMLNVDHKPIAEWDWPEMTMDFTVSESIDMELFEETMVLHLEISKVDSTEFLITNIHIPESETDTKEEDHSQMEHHHD